MAKWTTIVRMRVSWRDLFAVLTLLLLISCVFYKTVFLGMPISKIAVLAHWDSFFYDQARGQNMSLDPTTLLLHIPMYFLVGNIWRSGVLPLWNPLSGCGSPLVGDIESNIFSPWKLLFALSPSLKVYNYILVGEVACCALGTYLLARLLRLPYLSSLFAAISFSFCPYILNYLELANGPAYCFLPIVFFAFALLARSINVTTIVFTAFTCSILIFSGHPESAFFGIISGVALAAFLRLFCVFDNSLSPLSWHSLFKLSLGLVAVGLFAFAFSAPILLPFLEFLRNSECYKFVQPYSSYVSWQAVLAGLLAPCFLGASPYLGVAILPALIIGFFNRSKLWLALASLTLTMFLVVTQIGPIRAAFLNSGFTAIMTIYALPAFLLVLCLLGACGVQYLYRSEAAPQRIIIISAVLACILQIALVIPIRLHTYKLAGLGFDPIFPFTISRQSLQTVILCSIALATILFSKHLRQRHPNILACAVLLISWCSTAPTLALSRPVQPQFAYCLKEPLTKLNFSNARLLTFGEHLFRPDTNWVFGISDLRCEKSLFSKRYPQFMVACGARVDSHTQIFDGMPGPAFDFAAVPYVLAQSPVIDPQDELNTHKVTVLPSSATNNSTVSAGLTLENAQFNYLPNDFALSGDFTWRYLGNNKPPPYAMELTLSSADGKLLLHTDYPTLNQYPPQLNIGGYGPRQMDAGSTNSIIRRHVLLLIPTSLPVGSKVQLSMRVFDAHATQWTPIIYSAVFNVLSPSASGTKRRFDLIQENAYSTGDIVRLYRNRNALPQAYLVHNVIKSNSADESLALISKANFNVHTTAVIESDKFPSGISVSPCDQREDLVSLQRSDINSAVINVSATRPGLLVLADTFYPGWHAYIDGRQTPIFHCNYLFKSVFVSEGKHKIEFRYQPDSFTAGVILALLAALLGLLASIVAMRYNL